MAILNYTTTVEAVRSAAQIQEMLMRARCQALIMDFDDQMRMKAISFQIQTPHGLLSFHMPANADGVLKVLRNEKKLAPRYKTIEHANNVAWRIQKDWIEAQLAKVQSGMAELAEVFLPYAQQADGKTIYGALKDRQFPLLGMNS